MKRLLEIFQKKERCVVGLMSGTSADGIDAALVRVRGAGVKSEVELLGFENYRYDTGIRENIFRLFDAENCKVGYVCHMNFLLGELFAEAALNIIQSVGFTPGDIDLIGSHGQTVYHSPVPVCDRGYEIRSTLQIGEPSVIAERTGIVTVADFRVRDVAAGGQGAPLVPYTEYILYRSENECIGLQNIGGISNITVLPANCSIDGVFAFDNGPGNMVIDEVVKRVTGGAMQFDEGGRMAGQGRIHKELLDLLMEDDYFTKKPPKTTGREYFGLAYADRIMQVSSEYGICGNDIVATATALTARAIAESCSQYVMPRCRLDKIVIGGGGSYNKSLVNLIRGYLPELSVLTQEDVGFNSDAKEAVAFALLANEAVNGNYNNVPGATGARNPVIMGKIII